MKFTKIILTDKFLDFYEISQILRLKIHSTCNFSKITMKYCLKIGYFWWKINVKCSVIFRIFHTHTKNSNFHSQYFFESYWPKIAILTQNLKNENFWEFSLTMNQLSSKNSSQFTPSLPTTIPMISPATTESPLVLAYFSKFGKINQFQIIWNFSWKTALAITISMTQKVMQMLHFHSSR